MTLMFCLPMDLKLFLLLAAIMWSWVLIIYYHYEWTYLEKELVNFLNMIATFRVIHNWLAQEIFFIIWICKFKEINYTIYLCHKGRKSLLDNACTIVMSVCRCISFTKQICLFVFGILCWYERVFFESTYRKILADIHI